MMVGDGGGGDGGDDGGGGGGMYIIQYVDTVVIEEKPVAEVEIEAKSVPSPRPQRPAARSHR
jgi:hypothetical protein